MKRSLCDEIRDDRCFDIGYVGCDRLCGESMDIIGDRFGLRLLGDRHQVWLNQSAPCFGTMYYGNRHYS